MEKTCGTCANGEPSVYCNVDEWHHRAENTYMPKACGHYTERTDSIEQVAREMFVDLKMEAAEGEGLYDEDVIHEYRDRLTALGVDV